MGPMISARRRAGTAFGAIAICAALTGAAMSGHHHSHATIATASAAEPMQHHSSAKDTAPDPDAPAGAPVFWLPKESWVLEHWLPYDHRRLLSRLHTDVAGLIAWVHDDVHTLAQLAESKDQDPERLADYLVKPWRGHVSRRQLRVLRSRTMRTLTQSHLIHHLFGHPFHQRTLQRKAEAIYGSSPQEIGAMRKQGMSFVDIAKRNGRSADRIYEDAMQVLRASADGAVRHHDVPRAWRRYWLNLQSERLRSYQAARPGKNFHEDR